MCYSYDLFTVALDQVSGFDADCPGDTIHYLCSVYYNVFLTWRIVLPNNVSLNITYSNIEDISGNVLLHMDPDITSFVTEFMPGQLIESTIVLTIPYGDRLNGTVLECITSGNSTSTVVYSSAPIGTYNNKKKVNSVNLLVCSTSKCQASPLIFMLLVKFFLKVQWVFWSHWTGIHHLMIGMK